MVGEHNIVRLCNKDGLGPNLGREKLGRIYPKSGVEHYVISCFEFSFVGQLGVE